MKSTEYLETPQDLNYAGYYRRSFAALVDGLILAAFGFLAFFAVYFLSTPAQLFNPSEGLNSSFWTVSPICLMDSAYVLVSPVLIAYYFFFPTSSPAGNSGHLTPLDWTLILFWAAILVINWLYHALMESSPKQATFGKQAFGIKVTDLWGNRPPFWRSTSRHFAKIASTVPLFMGFGMINATAQKQALHDILSGCLVVKK